MVPFARNGACSGAGALLIGGGRVRPSVVIRSSSRPAVSGAATAIQITAATTSTPSSVNVSGRPSTGHSTLPKSSGAKPVMARLDDEAQPKPAGAQLVG